MADEWGSRRFLRSLGSGSPSFAAAVTMLVAVVDPDVRAESYLGGITIGEALVVAWGLWFPDRVVRIYFVLPIKGYWLAWGTIAVTVIYAIYAGWASFLPAPAAEGGMLGWLFRRSITGRWNSFQRERRARAEQDRKRTMARKRAASAAHLPRHRGRRPWPAPSLPSSRERSTRSCAAGRRSRRRTDASPRVRGQRKTGGGGAAKGAW